MTYPLSRTPFCGTLSLEGWGLVERGESPTPKISALLRKRPVLLQAHSVLTKDRKRPYYRHFCGKIHRKGCNGIRSKPVGGQKYLILRRKSKKSSPVKFEGHPSSTGQSAESTSSTEVPHKSSPRAEAVHNSSPAGSKIVPKQFLKSIQVSKAILNIHRSSKQDFEFFSGTSSLLEGWDLKV